MFSVPYQSPATANGNAKRHQVIGCTTSYEAEPIVEVEGSPPRAIVRRNWSELEHEKFTAAP